ncbi:MAG: hypothetical protein O7G31_14690 [Calditrichaeota bacterium]|nr:hypothetical protein [Calditrichota bacterium]
MTSNKGKKTPGVDGVLWKTVRVKMQAVLSLRQHRYNAQPLRRIYIPRRTGRMHTDTYVPHEIADFVSDRAKNEGHAHKVTIITLYHRKFH